MKDHNKNIDKIIKQNLKIEETSSGFSDNVMEQIYDTDLKKEKALSSLLQRHIIEETTIDFTSKVLASIEQKSKVAIYQPVISKKVWFIITSVIAFVLVYTLLNEDAETTQNIYLESFLSKVTGLFTTEYPTLSISPLFALSIFALSSLLILDHFLRNRRLFS
jgi:hypothetical protein